MQDEHTKWKYLPAKRLAEICKQLPENSVVGCNDVGNLMVVDSVTHEQTGYIDMLLEGEFEWF